MRLANMALADLAEGLNRGWGERDSRSIMLCQLETRRREDRGRSAASDRGAGEQGEERLISPFAVRHGRARGGQPRPSRPVRDVYRVTVTLRCCWNRSSRHAPLAHHIAQHCHRVPHIDKPHIERRQAEAQHVGRAEIADHATLDQRLHDRVAVRMRERDLAAARASVPAGSAG